MIDQQTINYYSKYFNLSDVMKVADDLKNAIESGRKLNREEAIASVILAYLWIDKNYIY